MTDVLLFRLQNNKARVLEEANVAWKDEDDLGGLTYQAEDFVAECLQFPDGTKHLLRRIWRLAENDQIGDYQTTGKEIQDLLDRIVRILETATGLTDGVALVNGRPVEGSERLKGAAADMREMRQQFEETWPWTDVAVVFDETHIEESLHAYRRGEHLSPEESLHELQGSSGENN